MQTSKADQGDRAYPMKVAVRRTGLSPHVIRVWERRYQAVVPRRSGSNRRLYTDEDIDRLQLLHRAIQSGHSIGRIANLAADDLHALVVADQAVVPGPVPPAAAVDGHFEPARSVDRCLAAVGRFDATALEDELGRAAVALSQIRLFQEVAEPLLRRVGDQWQEGALRVADEHLASAVVRSFVGGLSGSLAAPESGPGLVTTTPAGQLHELGALLVATTASSLGWRSSYLGPNLPVEGIAAAAQQSQARAVALSISYPADDPRVGPDLVRLRRYLGPDVALLVGGRAAPAYQSFFEASATVYLDRLPALPPHLESLRLTAP